MSYKTFKIGLEDIRKSVATLTDKELEIKLYNMGFRTVPSHFIQELKKHL